jgi:hypothetical protein
MTPYHLWEKSTATSVASPNRSLPGGVLCRPITGSGRSQMARDQSVLYNLVTLNAELISAAITLHKFMTAWI